MKNVIFIFISIFLFGCAVSRNNQNTCKYYWDKNLKSRVYTEVDSFPFYSKNEQRDIAQYIQEEFKFPVQNEFQSRTVLSFIVNKKGKVINPTIVRKDTSRYTLFDKEAIRVYKNMKRWNPGKCNGKEVNTKVVRVLGFLLKK